MKTEFIRLAVPVGSWVVDQRPVAIRRHARFKLPVIVQLRPGLPLVPTNGNQPTARLWIPGPHW